jgi:hypothetical protein
MTEFTEAIDVNVSPDLLFAYVGNPEKLAQYAPRVVSVRRRGNEVRVSSTGADGTPVVTDAWIRIKANREIEWGVEGRDDYGGEARVRASDTGALLVVTVRLGGDADFLAVNRELRAMLQTIKQIVETGAGR